MYDLKYNVSLYITIKYLICIFLDPDRYKYLMVNTRIFIEVNGKYKLLYGKLK